MQLSEPVSKELEVSWRFLPATFAGIYFVLSTLWILISDTAVAAMVEDQDLVRTLQSIKGMGFILASAACMFLILRAWERQRERVANELRMSRDRFRTMADNAPVLIWISSQDGQIVFVNASWLRFTGKSMQQELGSGRLDDLHPDDREAFFRGFRDAVDSRRSFVLEYRLRRHDGEYRWLLDYGVPLLTPDGRYEGFIGSCIDITDSKLDRERQLLLMRELDHRVKNSLAAVVAVAESTFSSTKDRETFRDAFIGRVHAMARSHTALAKGRWTSLYLGELASTILEPISDIRMNAVRFSGDAVLLPPAAVPPLAMILHELGTNALKHGALSHTDGSVRLTWALDESDPMDRRVEIRWIEQGGPIADRQFAPDGLGTRLIRGLAETELGGTYERIFRLDTFTSRVSFSLDRWRTFVDPQIELFNQEAAHS